MEAYLEAFMVAFDLDKHIRYGTTVLQVSPIEGGSNGARLNGRADGENATTSQQNGVENGASSHRSEPLPWPRWRVTTAPTQVIQETPRSPLHRIGLSVPIAMRSRCGSLTSDQFTSQECRQDISTFIVRTHHLTQLFTECLGDGTISDVCEKKFVSWSALPSQGTASTSSSPQQEEEDAFDAVVVCNGHYSNPRRPKLPGAAAFPGRILHSHSYRRNEHFAGLTVVVIGASASGEDISREIALVANKAGAHLWAFSQQLPVGPNQHNCSQTAKGGRC